MRWWPARLEVREAAAHDHVFIGAHPVGRASLVCIRRGAVEEDRDTLLREGLNQRTAEHKVAVDEDTGQLGVEQGELVQIVEEKIGLTSVGSVASRHNAGAEDRPVQEPTAY